MSSLDDGPEIVRFYTRARRFPQLIGKTPDGFKIPGGPYTYTQTIVGAAMIWLGSQILGVWGRFGLIGNFIVLAAVTYGVVFSLGRLPVGGRSPLTAATGLLRAFSTSPHGHLAGRPLRPTSPHRLTTRLTVQGCSGGAPHGTSEPAMAAPQEEVEPVREPAPARQELHGVQKQLAVAPASAVPPPRPSPPATSSGTPARPVPRRPPQRASYRGINGM